MKNKGIEIKKKLRLHPRQQRAGRVTKNNHELLERRKEVFRLWSMGVYKTELAEKYGVCVSTINDDIAFVIELEPIKDIKEKLDANLKEAIRASYERISAATTSDGARVGFMNAIIDAVEQLAKIHGLNKDSNNFYVSQTINNLSQTENRYAKADDITLQEEFKRRRLKIEAPK